MESTIKTLKNTAALQPKAKTAAAKKTSTAIDFLNDDRFKAQLAAALPRFLDTDRFVRCALTEMRLNPALAECTVPSVLGYFMQAAACGLEPGTVLGYCYPVPFRNKNTGKTECTFLLSYRGMMEIARRSGKIARFEANVVHENDEFVLEYGFEQKCKYVPVLKGDAGKMIGVYVQVDFVDPNTKPLVLYMTKEEIEKHRKRSRAANSGPWVTDYDEMAKKTVLRAVFKLLPVSIEQVQATTTDGGVSRVDMSKIGTQTDMEDMVEVEFVSSDDTGNTTEAAVDDMAEQMGVEA